MGTDRHGQGVALLGGTSGVAQGPGSRGMGSRGGLVRAWGEMRSGEEAHREQNTFHTHYRYMSSAWKAKKSQVEARTARTLVQPRGTSSTITGGREEGGGAKLPTRGAGLGGGSSVQPPLPPHTMRAPHKLKQGNQAYWGQEEPRSTGQLVEVGTTAKA